jgi:hypothetical protein
LGLRYDDDGKRRRVSPFLSKSAALKHFRDVIEPQLRGEPAGWRAKLPAGSRFAIMAALRRTLGAAVDWGYIGENPAKKPGRNPQSPPRPVRPYTFAELVRRARRDRRRAVG